MGLRQGTGQHRCFLPSSAGACSGPCLTVAPSPLHPQPHPLEDPTPAAHRCWTMAPWSLCPSPPWDLVLLPPLAQLPWALSKFSPSPNPTLPHRTPPFLFSLFPKFSQGHPHSMLMPSFSLCPAHLLTPTQTQHRLWSKGSLTFILFGSLTPVGSQFLDLSKIFTYHIVGCDLLLWAFSQHHLPPVRVL